MRKNPVILSGYCLKAYEHKVHLKMEGFNYVMKSSVTPRPNCRRFRSYCKWQLCFYEGVLISP